MSATTNGVPPDTAKAQAQAQLNGIIQADTDKNRVAVHTFDPNATPQEKAAAAGKGREAVKSIRAQNGQANGKALIVDTGASKVVPTITISDDGPEKKPENGSATASPTLEPTLPGEMPETQAPPIPDWYKLGWRAVGGIDDDLATEEIHRDKSILREFVDEQYYGAWYHNAALVFFAVFSSHFLTRFGLGWGWLFIILAFCNTYYSVSMKRFRRQARDDIQRELVKTKLASETESADWINNFLDRFWLIYEPILSQTIVASVDQILSINTPPFLESLRLSTFTLGTKAPRIDHVRTFPKTENDIVIMDWGISFTPNDDFDATPRELQYKVNPKIVLSIKMGKGFVGPTIPVLLEDITFKGNMRIRLKLMSPFPHVQIVDLSFLEKPIVDFVLRPIGNFDISSIPGLQNFITETLHSVLGPMMYEPNVFTLNLQQMLSGAPLDTAIGVLQVTIDSARGIKGTKIGGGTPDPYVSMSINRRSELATTKYKHNTYNPSWHETKFILVNNLSEQLMLSLYDFNDHRKDALLGEVAFDMNKLIEDAIQENLEDRILHEGKDRGMLRYHVSFYPVLKPQALAEGAEEELPDTNVGIVRLTIHQAKDLDQSKANGDLDPFIRLFIGDSRTAHLQTDKRKHTNAPLWETSTEFLCSDKQASIITLKVLDDRDFLKDPLIGYMSVRLTDLLETRAEAGRDWWPLSGCKSGRVRLTAEWKPLNMAGSLHGAEAYSPPIGVVRLWLQKAVDVKNVEAALGGKSDPYVRVQIANVTRGRTEVVNNNLNPEWDQIVYIPVHNLRENLLLECMDYQHLTKDRSLGSTEIRVSELAQESDNTEYPYASLGKKAAQDPLRLDKGGGLKGKLHYVAEFIPSLALTGVRFDGVKNEVQRAVEEGQGDDDGDDVQSSHSSMKDEQPVPTGVTVSSPMGSKHKRTESAATTGTVATTVTAAETPSKTNGTEREIKGVTMSKEELLSQQSGILVCNIVGGLLAKRCRLEVLLDDGYWPAFSTIKPRSTHATWDTIGEGFVKELDFGRIWLRLNDNDEGEKDDVIAEWKGDVRDFLERTLDGRARFTLSGDDTKGTSTVEIESRFVPVTVKLEARESINNQGTLRVELIDGRDIVAADRGGKSDPYAVFSLNGNKVFKSQTKKKTLSPEWNETFVVGVTSRVGAVFELEIFDWNQIEQAKKLGSGLIELADLEPFQGVERTVKLSHTRHGEKGEIRVRLLFTPEVIYKTRAKTSTFSSAGRAMTQIGGLPLGAGQKVKGGVGGIFKRDHAQNNSIDSAFNVESPPVLQVSPPSGDGMKAPGLASFPSHSSSSIEGSTTEAGTLRVTVMSGQDISDDGDQVKAYVTVRIGDKEQKTKHAGKTTSPEWSEAFNFTAGALTPKAYFYVHEHKTLGKDKQLGDGEIEIWRHIQQRGQTTAEVQVDLSNNAGAIRVRLEFDADATPATSTLRSKGSSEAGGASPSRFSMSRRRLPVPSSPTPDNASD